MWSLRPRLSAIQRALKNRLSLIMKLSKPLRLVVFLSSSISCSSWSAPTANDDPTDYEITQVALDYVASARINMPQRTEDTIPTGPRKILRCVFEEKHASGKGTTNAVFGYDIGAVVELNGSRLGLRGDVAFARSGKTWEISKKGWINFVKADRLEDLFTPTQEDVKRLETFRQTIESFNSVSRRMATAMTAQDRSQYTFRFAYFFDPYDKKLIKAVAFCDPLFPSVLLLGENSKDKLAKMVAKYEQWTSVSKNEKLGGVRKELGRIQDEVAETVFYFATTEAGDAADLEFEQNMRLDLEENKGRLSSFGSLQSFLKLFDSLPEMHVEVEKRSSQQAESKKRAEELLK